MKKIFASKTSKVNVCHTIVLGGEAGEGIKVAGRIIAKSLISKGYNVFVYDEFPSLIRGGHNSVHITFSPYPVYTVNKEIDILICLDQKTYEIHQENLVEDAVVLYDSFSFEIEDTHELHQLIHLPLEEILRKNKLPNITKNLIGLSAALNIAGIEKNILNKIITKEFKNKPEILASDLIAISEGYSSVVEFKSIKEFKHIPKKSSKTPAKKYLMQGNEAISLGAIKSGLGFYAAYPMTPASSILDYLSSKFREYNFIVKQTEDEIAAINMAIGAAFAGARSMVGTAGGGFSLMVEGLGLAAITEVPIVIVLAQRPGPATGLPTWTGQSDLLFALHASQDEFPRIILTPTDAEEAFYLSFEALNYAEKYQMPVILMTDKFLSESDYYFEFDKNRKYKIERGLLLNDQVISRLSNYERYEFTPTGISPRSIPGQPNGIYLANSDESDTKGFTNEDKENRKLKVEKRYKKLELLSKDLPELNVYGDIKSKICFITWGSTKGAVLEAMRRLQAYSIPTKLLALNYISPFPSEEVAKFIKSSKKIILVENNYSSQLGSLIKTNLGYDIVNKILKYDGRPIYADEIVDYVSKSKKTV